jgi:hypothetical protein
MQDKKAERQWRRKRSWQKPEWKRAKAYKASGKGVVHGWPIMSLVLLRSGRVWYRNHDFFVSLVCSFFLCLPLCAHLLLVVIESLQ